MATELWSYTAAIADSDKAATDAALAAVSGDFANLFSLPCIAEDDAPDMSPPRGWTTGVFQIDRPQRREIKNAIKDMPTITYEEQDRHLPARYPTPSELFIARRQWRFQPTWDEESQTWSHTYVHSTGLFKTGALSSPQTLGSDWAMIDQWDKEQDMINTVRSGDGNRIQVDFDGRYYINAKGEFDRTQNLDFQWLKNTEPFGAIYHYPDGTTTGEIVEEVDLLATDKIGIVVRSTDLQTTPVLNLLQGSWMGLRRIY